MSAAQLNMRVIGFTVIVVMFLVLMALVITYVADAAISLLARLPGLGFLDGISGWIWPVLLAIAWMRGWLVINRPYNCHGEIVINAEVEDIWDHIRPRVRANTFHGGFGRIVGLPGEPDRFDMILDPRLLDNETNQTDRLQVCISAQDARGYIRLTYLNADQFPLFAKESVSTEYFLDPVEDGTKVTMVESLARITPTMVIAFLYLNPAKDGLKRLKATVEGLPDPSRMGGWMDDMDPKSAPSDEVQR
jgi:hypothetical protein